MRHSRMMVSLHTTFESPEVAAGVSSASVASAASSLVGVVGWAVPGLLGSGGKGRGAWKMQLGLWQQYLSRWVGRQFPVQASEKQPMHVSRGTVHMLIMVAGFWVCRVRVWLSVEGQVCFLHAVSK